MDGRAKPLMDRQVVEVSSLSLFLSLFLWLSIYLSIHPSIYLSIYLLQYLPTYLSIYLATYLPIYLSIYLSVCLSIYLFVYLSIYLSVCLSIYLAVYLSIFLSFYPSIYLSIYLSIYPSIYLSICLSVYLSIYYSIYLPTYLSIYLATYLPTYLSIYLSFYLSSCLSAYLSVCLSVYPSIYLSICLSVYLSGCLSIYLSFLSIYLSVYLSSCPSIYLAIYLSFYLSICLSVYLSTCLSASLENKAILQDVLRFWTWQHQKRSNSARLLHFSKLTTSKTKQFCETSSIFELDNVKNELILRVFIFRSWQQQKRNNSARRPSKMESWVQSWRPRTNAFCDFSSPLVWSTASATKKWCQVIRSAAPVTQNHLSKPENLRLQNATPLRKSAPGPPNSSDEHVSCTAPATENASFQILFKCPTPANVFGNATKPSFCSLLTRSTIPCACHAKWHLNVQKWSEHLHHLNLGFRGGPYNM